jgi:hypothetical protein
MTPTTRQICFLNAASFADRAAGSRDTNPPCGAGSAPR